MLKWIEATGKTEDAAVQNALAQLGLDRDSVSVEVLERARSGFLGFGSTPAKVKVTYEVPDEAPAPAEEPVPAAPVRETPQPAPVAKKEKEPAKKDKAPAEKAPAQQAAPQAKGGDLEDRIRAFLSGLLDHMGVEAEINIAPKTENGILVTLEGPKLGALIGHRGETLDAIQQLTNYAVNSGKDKRIRVHVDAENYRARREASLESLAMKVAAKVKKYRRSVTLEAMNAYERHVIHAALQDVKGVTTYSVGTEPNRRVVVACDRESN